MTSAYLHCPKCGNTETCKNGTKDGKQRYRCKKCPYNFTGPQRGPSAEMLEKVISMYVDDLMSFRAIGREVGRSGITVKKWVEKVRVALNEEGAADNEGLR